MLLDQQIYTRGCLTASYFLPIDFLVVVVVVVVGTQVKHSVVDNSAQVYDLLMLIPHMRNSHGS